MNNSYWQARLGQRVSRRRALATAAGAGSAAVVLGACGGSGADGKDESSLIAKPADTTGQAKRGGTIKDRIHADVATLDVANGISALNASTSHVSSTLVQFKPGFLKPSENEVIPDLIESWEYSPDGLSITLKLRQGVKWHNKAPVNGRTVDVDDLVFSWNRFVAKGASRSAIANAVDPGAPVLSITPADSKTLLMKLKEPVVYTLGLFASTTTGYPIMVPKETDSTFDPRADMIGTGPFMLTNYTASQGLTFKRNPDYWDNDHALADVIEMPIVPEYATTLAQFKAGNLYSFSSYGSAPKITAEDVLPVKREEGRISVYQSDFGTAFGGTRILIFGWLPAGKSPFLDERVRQAISMSWDRDLYLDTAFNISRFEKDGLPVRSRWNTALLGTQEGWWIDPKAKEFGPNAKYFQKDITEAKKLLTAAGFANGFDTASNYVTTSELPTSKHAEIIDQMIAESGIRSKVNPIDYSSVYIPRYRNGRGQFEGWGYKSAAGGATGGDAIGMIANEYWSKVGVTFHGFSTTGQNDMSGDPQVESMIEKGRVERDTEKRRAIAFELQRYLAKTAYALNPPGVGTGFVTAWPALANFNVFQGSRQNYKLWVDQTKPPFKSR